MLEIDVGNDIVIVARPARANQMKSLPPLKKPVTPISKIHDRQSLLSPARSAEHNQVTPKANSAASAEAQEMFSSEDSGEELSELPLELYWKGAILYEEYIFLRDHGGSLKRCKKVLAARTKEKELRKREREGGSCALGLRLMCWLLVLGGIIAAIALTVLSDFAEKPTDSRSLPIAWEHQLEAAIERMYLVKKNSKVL